MGEKSVPALSLRSSRSLCYLYDHHSLVVMLVGVACEGFDFSDNAVADCFCMSSGDFFEQSNQSLLSVLDRKSVV